MTVEEYKKIPLNEDILIKYKGKNKDGNEVLNRYYVVNKLEEGSDYYGRYVLVEAAGEQISTWDIEDIEDWVPCKELDKFFKEKNQQKNEESEVDICR